MNKRDLRMIKSGTLPRDADLRNGSRQEGKREREHLQNNIKPKSKVLQDLPVNVAINSRLLVCKI
jgi:hypothetical protein